MISKRKITIFTALLLVSMTRLFAGADPLVPYLDGKAPEILREVASTNVPPESITVRRVIFRGRDDSEIFAVIAKPKTAGKHPGILVLHGGGQCADVDKAMAWAQRGYVAVAPDLPGIADPKKLTEAKGRWSNSKYGEGRWVATPDGSASVIFDAVLSAMKSLELLRAQPEVDTGRIGVVGVSWGGYMTTMVAGLAGDRVRAAFAVFGCGFYDLAVFQQVAMNKMPADEHERWLRDLDAGRRAPGIKAAFFLAAAANDYFYWPPAVQATLDAIPGEKNHLFAPNNNHKALVPGGSGFETVKQEPDAPPRLTGSRANWLAMEAPYFDYYLKGIGKPFPKVSLEKTNDAHLARFSVVAPHPIAKAEVCWAKADPAGDQIEPATVQKDRQWNALSAEKTAGNIYEAKLPAEAGMWFALVSDDRPVTVSSDMVHVAAH